MADIALQPPERSVEVAVIEGAPEQPSLPDDRGRFFALDHLRFVAMVDIVSSHVTGEHLLHGIGLPILLLISAGLLAGRVPSPSPAGVVARRARRLLVPWVFWSVVYAACLVALNFKEGRWALAGFHPRMLLYGPVIHLWFVPFIFLSAPVVAVIARAAHRCSSVRAMTGAAVAGVCVLLASATARTAFNFPAPFGQWVFSLGTIPLGVAVGQALAAGGRKRLGMLLALTTVGVLVALLGVESIGLPLDCEQWLLRRFGLALAAVCLLACGRGRDGTVTRLMVRTTFGVYLVHPLVLMILREMGIVTDRAWPDFFLVYALSMILTLAMRAIRFRRFV